MKGLSQDSKPGLSEPKPVLFPPHCLPTACPFARHAAPYKVFSIGMAS